MHRVHIVAAYAGKQLPSNTPELKSSDVPAVQIHYVQAAAELQALGVMACRMSLVACEWHLV